MWYVIQTITGKEQELVNTIKQVMARERKAYEQCFVIYQEYACRNRGKLEFRVEPLFPSYVFTETDTPEEFFFELKRVPRMSNLLGVDGCFWSINKEEEEFLRHMVEESDRGDGVFDGGVDVGVGSDLEGMKPGEINFEGMNLEGMNQDKEKEYVIRPSLVQVDDEGQIVRADGILGCYLDKIVKQRLRKRSVVIEVPFCGKKRRIRLGVRLEEDDVG